MKRIYLLYLLVIAISISCSETEEAPFVPETLEEGNLYFSRSKGELETLLSAAGIEGVESYLEYDVDIYQVTYKTEYLGEEITASGIVTFPATEDAVPMLSFQHGTIAAHREAPTQDQSGTYYLLSGMASAGYILLIPDFIGFGSSDDVLHPYYHAELTGSSIVDMLEAARELAIVEGYNFNGDVFLAGYSEGGYATMAAHKMMEENPVPEMELVASAPSSGGYDVKGMQEYFFGLESYHQPFFLAYVALSYKTAYNWSEPLSIFFNEPYASNIPTYFDGSLSGSQINAQLTTTIADYVNADFLNGVDTDATYSKIVDAFEENSLDNWVPTKRMMMYHGTDDITVPYQNSVDTYENFINLGADPSVVTFTDIPGATHGSGAIPYISDIVVKFDNLK